MSRVIDSSASVVCHCCGKTITPPYEKAYKHGNYYLCVDCENQRHTQSHVGGVQGIKNEQADKNELLATIQQVLQVQEIPDKWLRQIDSLVKEGKKYRAMAYTLKYAIQYIGMQPDLTYGLTGIINTFYYEAAEYYAQEEAIKATNEQFQPVQKTKKIKMRAPQTTSWSPTSNIEDL